MDFYIDEKKLFGGKKICAITGYRPQKLALSATPYKDLIKCIKSRLKQEIKKAVDEGYNVFLCGMALGVDIWAAEEIISLKRFKNINLYAVIPFEGQSDIWKEEDQIIYKNILNRCDIILSVSDHACRNAYLQRDEILVNHCEKLIAVYDENIKGGTSYTIKYAKKQGKEVSEINI
ncbi:MAG: DUF1273 domain-containing protein [Clostridiales bacterium]|nr:MAG: DUF1273 domain-containing protein [Clostridiales bacterium]